MEFDSVYKQYLAQKNVLNWQFYHQNLIKCEETSSTQNNVDETEEEKDFHVQKIDTSKDTMDGTIKEIVKKRKRLHQPSKKQLKKIQENKTKTDG